MNSDTASGVTNLDSGNHENVVASDTSSNLPQAINDLNTANTDSNVEPSANASISSTNNHQQLNISQQQNLIRIVTNMFHQQAHLAQQQANILQRISKKMHDNPNWKIDIDDLSSPGDTADTNAYMDSKNAPDEQHTVLDKAEIQKRLEREAVVKLAMKSYQGMKELQSTMNIFLETQSKRESDSQHNRYRAHSNENDMSSDNGHEEDNGNEESIFSSRDIRNMTPAKIGNVPQQPSSNLKRERDEDSTDDEDQRNDNEKTFSSLNVDIQDMTPVTTSQMRKRLKRERDESSSDDSTSSRHGSEDGHEAIKEEKF